MKSKSFLTASNEKVGDGNIRKVLYNPTYEVYKLRELVATISLILPHSFQKIKNLLVFMSRNLPPPTMCTSVRKQVNLIYE